METENKQYADIRLENGPLISRKQVCSLVGVESQTLANWLCNKDHPFPKGIPMGNGPRPRLRWYLKDVEDYLDRQKAA